MISADLNLNKINSNESEEIGDDVNQSKNQEDIVSIKESQNKKSVKFQSSLMAKCGIQKNQNVFDAKDSQVDSKQQLISVSAYKQGLVKNKGIKKLSFILNYQIKKYSFYFHQNFYFLIIVNICTFYALFGDFFRIIIFNKPADIYFNILVLICFSVFLLEILIYLFSEKNYFMGFYFYLDMISTIFLIFDLTFIQDKMINENAHFSGILINQFAKAVRLIRLIRILKLFKRKNIKNLKKKNKIKNNQQQTPLQESKITKRLKELNIKRLILLILLMLITVPLFDYGLWKKQKHQSYENLSLFLLPRILKNPNGNSIEFIKNRFKSLKQELVVFKIEKVVDYQIDYSKLRKQEIRSHFQQVSYKNKQYDTEIMVSRRYEEVIQNILNLFNMIVICLLLIFSIYFMNQDFSQLILNPLERMIERVKIVTLDPLQVLKNKINLKQNNQMNETLVIEQSIQKISELLILGFGQAGCKIISHFLFDPDKDFEQIIPGQRTFAIFGFCDIRKFTDVTEILLQEVMKFVNTIAEIVHNQVDKYGGAANKNIGDAFLLVWKLIYDYKQISPENEQKSIKDINQYYEQVKKDQRNKQLAELSLISFVEIIIEMETDKSILEYKQHPLIKNKIENYSVKLGFGLHIGWAIEGAIGSSYKIDASYLSPNVNMASYLEAATKQYKIMILFTGELYDMFETEQLKQRCRLVDNVLVKGFVNPLRFYTIDLNVNNLNKKEEKVQNKFQRLSSLKIDVRETLQLKFGIISKKIRTAEEEHLHSQKFQLKRLQTYEQDNFIEKKIKSSNFSRIFQLQTKVYKDFKVVFGFAVDCYISGNWENSKKFFDKARSMIPNDGPSESLYNYMKQFDFKCPSDWNNCRSLNQFILFQLSFFLFLFIFFEF